LRMEAFQLLAKSTQLLIEKDAEVRVWSAEHRLQTRTSAVSLYAGAYLLLAYARRMTRACEGG